MFRKQIMLITALVLILNVSPVYANSNILAFDSEAAEQELLNQSGEKVFLAKEWYDTKFEINPENTIGSLKMESVDSEEYIRALEEVQFPIEAAGEYKIYFLQYKLKDSFSTRALSFLDGSAVVFGNYGIMSEEKLHQLAVHELGHQIDFQLMTEEKWQEYKKLRDIENQAVFNNSTSEYTNRPQEIFAEDFRLLFGGETAQTAKHLNSDMKSPDEVPELMEFFLTLAE